MNHIGGRLGAVFGHKVMFTVGCTWWVLWALCGGFSNNLVSMCITRGLCGIGGCLMVPNIVALLGITFPPGKKRNLAMGLFGAMAPVAAVGGSLIGAVIIQLSDWKWVFLWLYVYLLSYLPTFRLIFIRGLMGSLVYAAAIVNVTQDQPVDPSGSVDWVGAYLGVAGLILFNFVWK